MNLILEADGEIHFKNDTEGTTQQVKYFRYINVVNEKSILLIERL